jgi:hypothetical protein
MAIYVIAKGQEGWTATGNMAANGFGEHSPGGYSLWAVIITEVLLTGLFMLVILGSTDDRAPKGFAGLSIGLTLTLIHLISIPISNTSVNPARSTGVAFFNGDGAPMQLWVFWLAPLFGAAIAGIAYSYLFGSHEELADRPGDYKREGAPSFMHLLPLSEIIAAVMGTDSPAIQAVWKPYNALIDRFGNEYSVLIDTPIDAIASVVDPAIAQAIMSVRDGTAKVTPGYDGVYGQLALGIEPLKVKVKAPVAHVQQRSMSDFW